MIYFILRSDKLQYKCLLEDLKRLANLGREEYPETLTNVFHLLARESSEYGTVQATLDRYYRRGVHGG